MGPAIAGGRMQIGRYTVRGRLGRGGWSIVYLAWDLKLEREVALKALAPESREDASARDRFLQEARTLARLRHPAIVAVYDVEAVAEPPFYTMELLDGPSAGRQAAAAGGLPLERVIALISAAAGALDYLHRAGLVHGDVKPANILLDRFDRPALIDFGLVRHLDGPDLGMAGTPPYMAPELLRGERVGAGADIYGLAVTAYELLTGRPPYFGDLPEILDALANRPVPPLRSLRPDLPPAVERVVHEALAKEPWQRPARAGIFAADLAAARLAGLRGRTAPRVTAAEEPPPPADRQPEPDSALLRAPPGSVTAPPGAPDTLVPAASPSSVPPLDAQTLAGAEASYGSPPSSPVPEPATQAPRPLDPATLASPAEPAPPSVGGSETVAPSGPARPDPDGIRLSSTVFAPPAVSAGETCFVQVFAHLPDQDAAVRALAREFDDAAERRGYTGIESLVVEGERLMFDLTLPGLEIDEPVQYMVWMSRPQSVQFGVTVPADHPRRTAIGTVRISRERVPIGHIKFKLSVYAPQDTRPPGGGAPLGEAMHVYRKAFISYASHDRREVLKRAQMLARMKIDFFQDVLDLEPGQRWERQLYRRIDECDLFLLFWSSAAKQSDWVLKEVEYALGRKGGDEAAPPEIVPVIIEGPPLVPPPPALSHLHFDDRLLYFMQ
jgi:serine/threonine-protein kinase